MRCSGPVEQGGDPGLDVGHTGEIMSLNWLRSALVYHQKKNWRMGLHRVRSGHLSLVCCTHNLANWQQMDLWMHEQNTKRGNIFYKK